MHFIFVIIFVSISKTQLQPYRWQIIYLSQVTAALVYHLMTLKVPVFRIFSVYHHS